MRAQAFFHFLQGQPHNRVRFSMVRIVPVGELAPQLDRRPGLHTPLPLQLGVLLLLIPQHVLLSLLHFQTLVYDPFQLMVAGAELLAPQNHLRVRKIGFQLIHERSNVIDLASRRQALHLLPAAEMNAGVRDILCKTVVTLFHKSRFRYSLLVPFFTQAILKLVWIGGAFGSD